MADGYARIVNGDVKQCPKCGLYKELQSFEDGELKTKVGRICRDCKKKKRISLKKSIETATAEMKHAKAETTPSEYECPKCGAPLVYRFDKKGKFLSCSGYPECKFAWQCDKEGKMVATSEAKQCPKCGSKMFLRNGRFGKFYGCSRYPMCKGTRNFSR